MLLLWDRFYYIAAPRVTAVQGERRPHNLLQQQIEGQLPTSKPQDDKEPIFQPVLQVLGKNVVAYNLQNGSYRKRR